nr:putative Zinc finger, BED-type [Ipomoea batatas]
MKRKRKLRSQVWDHFDRLITKNTNGETIVKAKCKYCEVLINSDSKYGTGNLKRHTINCVRKNTRDIGQMLIGGENGSMLMRSRKFSEEKFRELLISAIVMHNMPLSFVEYDGFRTVFSYLKDDVPTISRKLLKLIWLNCPKREKNKKKFMLDYMNLWEMTQLEPEVMMMNFEEFDNYECAEFGGSRNKSELEMYLDEQRIEQKSRLEYFAFLEGKSISVSTTCCHGSKISFKYSSVYSGFRVCKF